MTLQYELDRYVKDHQDEWYKEGVQDGEARGEAKGEARAKASLIEGMHAKGISVKDIADIANISVEEVEKILSATK